MSRTLMLVPPFPTLGARGLPHVIEWFSKCCRKSSPMQNSPYAISQYRLHFHEMFTQ